MRIQRVSKISDVFSSQLTKLAAEPVVLPEPKTEDKQYNVPDQKMDWLKNRIAKLNKFIEQLNKKGAEFGIVSPLPPVGLEILGDIQIPTDRENVFVPGKSVKVHGKAPDVSGWQFIATLLPMDVDGERSNIVKAVPGTGPVPEEYRTEVPKCDFCKQSRRRNETFLLRNAKGEYRQIGRNCLGKFLGVTSPEQMADLATSIADLFTSLEAISDEGDSNGSGGGGRQEKVVSIGEFVAAVIAITRAGGWLPGWKAKLNDRMSTAQMAFAYVTDKNSSERIQADFREKLEFREEDKEIAQKSIEWARELRNQASESLDDYLWNLAAATSQPVVSKQTAGIVGSVVSAYQRANSPVDMSKQGQSMFFRGKVISKKPTKTGSIMWEFQNERGEKVIWFDNQHAMDAELDKALTDGSQVQFEGMVKKVSSYMGQQQTQIVLKRFVSEQEFFEGVKSQEEKAKKADELKAAAPALAPGQKLKLKLTVVDVKQFESSYSSNTTKIYKFVDEFGRRFFWKTSTNQELEQGMTYDANVVVGWEKLPGVNKAKLDEQGNKTLAYDKYDPQAVKLDKVDPVGVEGKVMLSKEDIKVKTKERNQASQILDAAEAERTAILEKIWDYKSGVVLDQLYGYNSHELLTNEIQTGISMLQSEISKAQSMQASGINDFEPIEFPKSYAINSTFKSMRERQITPHEFLDASVPVLAKANDVIDKAKQYSPRLNQIADAIDAQRQLPFAEREIGMQKLMSEAKAIENEVKELIKGVPVNSPYISGHSASSYNIKNYAGQVGNIELDYYFTRDIENAKVAVQNGGPAWRPSSSIIPSIVHKDMSPQEFMMTAQAIIDKTNRGIQELPILFQQEAEAKAKTDAAKAFLNQKDDELGEMMDQRTRGKARGSISSKRMLQSWVHNNCKFATN